MRVRLGGGFKFLLCSLLFTLIFWWFHDPIWLVHIFWNLTCPGPVQLAFSLWWGNPFRPWKNWKPIWWGASAEILQKEIIYFWIPCFLVIFYGLYHPGSSRYFAFWLGFCGWFLIFWHNFLHTKGRSRNGNHQFSPPFLGDYVFCTFFQASSRVANPSFVAWHFQSYIDSWKIANLCQGKLPEVTYLPTLGTIIFKNYLGEAMQFCLEVGYLYPFCSLTSTTWVFPVFILKVRAFRIESW